MALVITVNGNAFAVQFKSDQAFHGDSPLLTLIAASEFTRGLASFPVSRRVLRRVVRPLGSPPPASHQVRDPEQSHGARRSRKHSRQYRHGDPRKCVAPCTRPKPATDPLALF